MPERDWLSLIPGIETGYSVWLHDHGSLASRCDTKRSTLVTRCFAKPRWNWIQLPPRLCARRSVFTLHGASLLVTEVFLPDILKLEQRKG